MKDAENAKQQTDTNYFAAVLPGQSQIQTTSDWYADSATTGSAQTLKKPSKQDGLAQDSKAMLYWIARWEGNRK